MKQDIEKVLISEEEIQQKVKELGATLTSDYDGKFPHSYWCFERGSSIHGRPDQTH